MTVYLIVFILTIYFYAIAVRVKDKWIQTFLLCLCILIPASVAGLRDLSIGKDLGGYGIRIWEEAISANTFNELQSRTHDIEVIYLGLNYIVSRFTRDIHWFLFIYEAIIMALIVLAAFRCRYRFNSEYIVIYMLFYLYCTSFNLIRQSIALVLMLLATTYIFEFQTRKSILSTVLACLSHNSAFFSVLLYPFKYVVDRNYDKKKKLVLVMAVSGLVCFSFYENIMHWLISMGLYSNHYEAYIGQVGFKTHKIELILILGMVASLYTIIKPIDRHEPYFSYSLCLLVIAYILNMYGSIVEIAVRIGLYFMVALAAVIPLSTTNIYTRYRLEIAIVVLLIGKFFYLAITTDLERTIPYKSALLGITGN